jgi:hypothetical protein
LDLIGSGPEPMEVGTYDGVHPRNGGGRYGLTGCSPTQEDAPWPWGSPHRAWAGEEVGGSSSGERRPHSARRRCLASLVLFEQSSAPRDCVRAVPGRPTALCSAVSTAGCGRGGGAWPAARGAAPVVGRSGC